MIPAIAAVHSRVAEITARYGAAGMFATQLAGAQSAAGGPASAPRAPSATPRSNAPETAIGDVDPSRHGWGGGTWGGRSQEWSSRLPAAGQPWAQTIAAVGERVGVDPRLLAALTWAESGFRPDARSHAGAIGLTQLMPATARGLGVDPGDPVANLEGGARYLRQQLDRFGSVELALAAYNAGPGRVAQAGGVPRIAETQAYVRRVADYYAQLR